MRRPALMALLLLGCGARAQLAFESCTLETPGTAVSTGAECARLEVAEDPQAPDGAQLSLRIARVGASRPRQRAADPLYFLAGGPGQAATEAWPLLAPHLGEITRRRDVILVDQRGTGGSNRLDCPPPEDDLAFSTRFDAQLASRQARDCYAALDADPRHYGTARAADDLESVRRALGHGAVNLLGVSYGTRLAQVYLRRHPQSVRRLILDGVVPPSLVLGTEHAPSLERALARVFERCAADSACSEAFGAPAQALARLRARIARDEVERVALRLPRSGEAVQLEVSPEILAMALRLLSYAGETQALVPLVLAEADAGRWQPLLSQALLLLDGLQEQLARGLELSVICSEDLPFYPENLDQADTLLGNLVVDALRAQCAEWPVPAVDASFHRPQRFSQPALLLSGEADPVTPPAYGDAALEQFPQGAHWVVPGRGHGVLRHGCLARLAARFLDGADPRAIDTSCVDAVAASPFFVDLTGPAP